MFDPDEVERRLARLVGSYVRSAHVDRVLDGFARDLCDRYPHRADIDAIPWPDFLDRARQFCADYVARNPGAALTCN